MAIQTDPNKVGSVAKKVTKPKLVVPPVVKPKPLVRVNRTDAPQIGDNSGSLAYKPYYKKSQPVRTVPLNTTGIGGPKFQPQNQQTVVNPNLTLDKLYEQRSGISVPKLRKIQESGYKVKGQKFLPTVEKTKQIDMVDKDGFPMTDDFGNPLKQTVGTGEYEPRKVFGDYEVKPDARTAKYLFEQIASGELSGGDKRKAYLRLTEKGKKAFLSYGIAHGYLDGDNVIDEIKADREKYAGTDYMSEDKAKKQMNINRQKAIRGAKADKIPLIVNQAYNKNDVAQPLPLSPTEQKMQELINRKNNPTPSGSARQLSQGMTQSSPQARKQAQDEANRLAQEEINRVINTPQTGVQKFARGAVSGLTAGLSEAGMTPEQKLAYMKAMAGKEQSMRISPRGEAIQTQQTTALSAYGAGQLAGMVAGGGIGEVGLRGGVLAGETLGKQVARGAVIGGTQQGVMSTAEGKTAGEIARDVAIGVGLGALGDVALNKIIGGIAKKYAGKAITPEIEQAIKTDVTQEVQKVKITPDTKRIKSSEIPTTEKQPSTVVSKPLKQTVGIETSQALKNVSKPTTEAKTAIEQVIENPRANLAEKVTPSTGKTLKERGYAQTLKKTPEVNPEIKAELKANELQYEVKPNAQTLQNANDVLSKGFDAAKKDFQTYAYNPKSSYSPEMVVVGEQLAKQASAAGNKAESIDIITDLASKLTEAGQFIQAVKILRRTEPEGMKLYLTKELNKINREALQRNKNWKNLELNETELSLADSLRGKSEKEKEAIYQQIAQSIADRVPSTTMEKLNAWRRMAMLLNPKTHIRNIGGNLFYSGLRKADDAVSQILEYTLPKTERTKAIGWSGDKQLVDKVNTDWKDNAYALLNGSANERFDFGRVLGQQKKIFGDTPLEKLNKKSFEYLEKEDKLFFGNTYKDSLGQYMKARGLTEVTDEARRFAKNAAEQATYRDLNALSSMAIGVKKKLGVVGEAVLPFAKTPANITMRTFEHSPLGLAYNMTKGALDVKKGKINANQYINNLAKGMTGTGIVGLGYVLAKNGLITGAPDKDVDKAAFDKVVGRVPYAFKIGDNYYTYDWAQPISTVLAMGAAIYQATKDNPNADKKVIDGLVKQTGKPGIGQITYDALKAGGDVVTNASMLQSIKRLLGNSFDSPSEAFIDTMLGYIKQGFPTVARQVATGADPYQRATQTKGLGAFKDYFKAGSPARGSLPIKYNIKGEPIKTVGGELGGRLAYSTLSPGVYSKASSDPVDVEISKLFNETQDKTIFPRVAPKSITVRKENYGLSVAEQNIYQKYLGQEQYANLGKLINSSAYKGANPEDKAKLVKKALDQSSENAKYKYVMAKGLAKKQ